MRARMIAKTVKAAALIFLGLGVSKIINDKRMRLIPKNASTLAYDDADKK
jgi:hypothetical protein